MLEDIIPYNLSSNCLSQISISKNLMGLVAGVACKVVLATNYSKLPGRGCILVGWESSFIWRVFVLLWDVLEVLSSVIVLSVWMKIIFVLKKNNLISKLKTHLHRLYIYIYIYYRLKKLCKKNLLCLFQLKKKY